MGRAETGIQSYCIQRLEMLERQQPVYFFRSNSFAGKVMRYNGSMGYISNVKRGMPDLIALFAGTYLGIELKSEKGRQSPEQKATQVRIEDCGGEYWLIRTPEEFERSVKDLMERKGLRIT